MNTVRPRLRCRSRDQPVEIRRRRSDRARRSARRGTGSRGSSASARASPARLRMPPDSSAGNLSAGLGRQADQRDLQRGDLVEQRRVGTRALLLERHLDVLGHGQRAEQRAVLEQHAPALLDLPHRAVRLSRPIVWPNTSIVPAAGRLRPTIVRSSTDLPVPEPPTTPSTSPRADRESRSSMQHLAAEARGQAAHADAPGYQRSELRQKRIEKTASMTITRKIDFDHRQGGQPADAFGAARDAQPFVAADQRDDRGEERRLDDAEPERPAGRRAAFSCARNSGSGMPSATPAHQPRRRAAP